MNGKTALPRRARVRFGVTFDIVTEESAEHGGCESSGWIDESATLRDAVKDLFSTRTCHVEGINGMDCEERRVTISNGMEFLTGAHESRTLHIPREVTRASAARIVRLLRCHSMEPSHYVKAIAGIDPKLTAKLVKGMSS